MLIDRDLDRAKLELKRLQELARDAHQEMRDLIFELRSAELEADGLVATLRKHIDVVRRIRRADVALKVTSERRLAPPLERELFRIAQEALNNALNHAGAAHIALTLEFAEANAKLSVCDDGCGFDPAAPDVQSKRLGLTSMRERANALGGKAEIASSKDNGTTVRVEVPLG